MDINQLLDGDSVLEHAITDALAPTTASDKQAAVLINITNAEFLRALFPKLDQGEYLWTTEFVINPKDAKGEDWEGDRAYLDSIKDTPYGNSYFSVSAYKPIKRVHKRRGTHFSFMPVVVLDDPQGCDLAPSWLLETSCWRSPKTDPLRAIVFTQN